MRPKPTNGLKLPLPSSGGTVGTPSVSSLSTISSVPPPPGGLNLPPPSFGRGPPTVGTRSVASPSAMSSIPPPPGKTTLQRAGCLRIEPGAQRYPGSVEPDDGTIIIGDGPGQSSAPQQPTISHALIIARPVQSLRSIEPITSLVQRIPERIPEAEAPTPQVHRIQNPQPLNDRFGQEQKMIAQAEPMEEEDKPKPFWKDGKIMCCILFLFVLAIGLGVGLAIGLKKSTSQKTNTSQVVIKPPTSAPTTPAPSSTPTEFLLYSPPDADTCETISNGMDVGGQENMILQEFFLHFDATLVPQVQDIFPFLEEINDLLQNDAAPEIAQCTDNTRALRKSRGLLTKYIIGNVIFDSVIEDSAICLSGADQQNCFRVVAILFIYLKDEVESFDLLAHILDSFSEGLQLGIPFESFELVGNSASGPGDDDEDDDEEDFGE